MKLNLVLFILLVARVSFSETIIGGGGQVRAERVQDQTLEPRDLRSIFFGIGEASWYSFIEYSKLESESGTGALSVKRKSEELSFSVDFVASSEGYLRPLLGGGLGVSREMILTQMMGSTETDEIRPNYFLFAEIGLKAEVKWVWVSLVARVTGFQYWDPNPGPGLVAKLGFQF